MNVRELIARLQEFDGDLPVKIRTDYNANLTEVAGGVEYDFTDCDDDDDDDEGKVAVVLIMGPFSDPD